MENVRNNPLADDLDHILDHTADLWEELRGRRIFITGGTGFFGSWFLEAFTRADDRLDLNAEVMILTRDPEAFRKKAPHLAGHPCVRLHVGDVRDFEFPSGAFSHVIHASNEAKGHVKKGPNRLVTKSMIQAAERVLDFAVLCGAKRFLFTSSGSVYGPQPSGLIGIPEDYRGRRDTDDFRAAHGEGKHRAELLCREYSKGTGLDARIARCFSFVGPYMPLDENYAVGNFIRDGMRGRTILVRGDGTPVRSYLYASDLVIWLLTILVRGESCQPYNVGSEIEIDIQTLAKVVARSFDPERDVRIAMKPTPGKPAERYVPSTEKGRNDLGLRQYVGLQEGIRKTLLWYGIPCEKKGEADPGPHER
jgi:nucleoside-diphosphate-sugar epimerase